MQKYTLDYSEATFTVGVISKNYFNLGKNTYPSDRCLTLTAFQHEFYFHIIFAPLELYLIKEFQTWKVC